MKTSWGYFTLFSHKFCTLLNSCIYCTLVSHVGVKCSQKKYYSYWCFFVSFPFIINQNICVSLFFHSFYIYVCTLGKQKSLTGRVRLRAGRKNLAAQRAFSASKLQKKKKNHRFNYNFILWSQLKLNIALEKNSPITSICLVALLYLRFIQIFH